MNLLHTLEEIKYFDHLETQSIELTKLGNKFNNEELLKISNKYREIIEKELNKYNSYIGLECTAPDSTIIPTGSRRKGKITGHFYFNLYSRSIRCRFEYGNGHGYDTHSISELKDL